MNKITATSTQLSNQSGAFRRIGSLLACLAALWLAVGTVHAQSNATSVNTAPVIGNGFSSYIGQLASVVASNGQAGSGLSYSLRGNFGPELDQSLGVFGYTGSNTTWQMAVEHTDAFYGGSIGTKDYIGANFMLAWLNPPQFLKYCLLNASHIRVKVGCGYPTDKLYNLVSTGHGGCTKDFEFSVGVNGNWGK